MENKRQRMLLILVGACLGLLALDHLVISPLTKLWKDRESRKNELRVSIAHGKMLINAEPGDTSHWKEMKAAGQAKELSVAENAVLNAVEKWAGASQLTVNSRKTHWLDDKECQKLEVRVSSTGTLNEITRFLYELEADPQPLKVEDMELTARDDRGQTLICELCFTRLVLPEDAKK